MNQPVELKVLIPFDTYRKGDRISPPGVMREFLVSRGFCELASAVQTPAILRGPVEPVRSTKGRAR
jgi:hypothetical protein